MTRFAAHRSEVSVGGVFALTVLGEAAPSPHAGGVTFEASRVVLLALGSQGFHSSVVRAFRPSFELARVAALARGRAHVVGVLGQHVSRLGVVTEQRGALLIRKLCDRDVRNFRPESRVVKTDRMRGIVTSLTNAFVVFDRAILRHEVG